MLILDTLPRDVLFLIGLQLDCPSLGSYHTISRKLYTTLNNIDNLTVITRTIIQRLTLLDLSSFTQSQLKYLYRILTRGSPIAAGGWHSLLLTDQGQVYSLGDNNSGQLGLDDRQARGHPTLIPKIPRPTRSEGETTVLSPFKITTVSAGGWHSLILDQKGQVFSFGSNRRGQLGLGLKYRETLSPLVEFSREIMEILDHRLRSMRPESFGVLYDSSSEEHRTTPTLMTSLPSPVRAISASRFHTLLLDSQGQVYSMGENIDGQLGLVTNDNTYHPTLIERIKGIRAISAGGNHSLILNQEGQVFGFGYNGHGQLGLGDCYKVSVPTLIRDLEKIVAISTGNNHSLVLDKKGRVFGFGKNNLGQVGFLDQKNQLSPRLINGLPKIAAISSGRDHSLFLSTQGQVFSCGDNTMGQLGLGNITNHPYPTLLTRIDEIIAISAGDSHSLILNKQGQVFSFGNNILLPTFMMNLTHQLT